MFLPEALKDAIFVGHLVTDLDSVAGAIGAAALYGGKAVLASDINSETAFALDRWGIKDGDDMMPLKIEDVLETNPDVNICLVDHQQTSQMVRRTKKIFCNMMCCLWRLLTLSMLHSFGCIRKNPAINANNVVGVIDHHALQNKTIVTDRPIYMWVK